jgi:hypothetical protein
MTILDLSTDELTKLINDEYSMVLASERNTLPRAKTIGEKLEVLRGRTTHGEWQTKLKGWCPKLSYETATRYIKLNKRWPDIEKAAAAKSVKTTDLTIDAALKLLAKPKTDKASGTNSSKGGIEPKDTKKPEDVGTEWLKALAPDELVTWLQRLHAHDTQYLQELSAGLGRVLRPAAQAA